MIQYQDNQFVNGFDIAFETLQEAKADRFTVVDLVAASLRNQLTSNTSAAEMASWPIKLAEASAGGGSMITLEASYRGVDAQTLITKILEKAQQLSVMEAKIAGVSGMHRDIIAAMTTIEEVVSYDMRSDWPEV